MDRLFGSCCATCGTLCDSLYLGGNYLHYVGLLGTVLCLIELFQVLQNGPELPNYLKRKRLAGSIISPAMERDIKLITNLCTAASYLAMNYGCIMKKKFYMYPWFTIQTIILVSEFSIFCLRLCKCETVILRRQELVCATFTVINWVQAFCFLRKVDDSNCWIFY